MSAPIGSPAPGGPADVASPNGEDCGDEALPRAAALLREEFPKAFLALSDSAGARILPRAVDSYWRSQELPPCEGESLGRKLARLLVYLRGEVEGLLEARPSLIAGAGQGLFVLGEVPKGAWVCVYSGTPLSLPRVMQAKERGDNLDYVMGGFGLYSVDAAEHPSVLARYINDPFDAPERRNVHFVKLRRQKKALVVALRDLEPGEELYAEYGDGYWRARGLLPAAAGEGPAGCA